MSEAAGEGLFARVDLRRGQLVALYNGIRVQSDGRHDEEWSGYRVRLNGQWDIDVPPEEVAAAGGYRATLGHKANHAFAPAANLRWSRLEHPRFGLVCSLVADRDVGAGEELLVDYGLGMADAPTWYKELWVRHCRQQRDMTDEQIEAWCQRQYDRFGKRICLPL